MRILFLSQRFLLPMDTGGKIRTGKILQQLSKRHEITLISNFESETDATWLREVFDLCHKFIPVLWKEIRKYSPLFFARLSLQMFSVYPVNVLNDYSRQLQRAVDTELQKGNYDLAICDFVQSGLVFSNVHGMSVPTILFQHNVESEIAKRHYCRASNLVAKLFWWAQWKKLLAFESKACHQFDTVIAVSENDKNLFKQLYGATNTAVIPTGVDIDYFRSDPDNDADNHRLVFCGSMDWLPNEDAVIFFVNEILPVIRQEIPDVTFTVIGRNPSAGLKNAVEGVPGVTLTGWVDDTRPYLQSGAVVVVPIRIGGGTRMKIFEAMSMAKPVVSTTIGAEGLPVDHGRNIFLRDSPVEFAQTVVDLLKHPDQRRKIGSEAREFVTRHFSWQHVTDVFERICQQTVQSVSQSK